MVQYEVNQRCNAIKENLVDCWKLNGLDFYNRCKSDHQTFLWSVSPVATKIVKPRWEETCVLDFMSSRLDSWILDWHFVKIELFVWKRPKINEKRPMTTHFYNCIFYNCIFYNCIFHHCIIYFIFSIFRNTI